MSDRCSRHKVETTLKAKRNKTSFQSGSIGEINEYMNNHDRSQGTVLAFVGVKALSVETRFLFDVVSIGDNKYCVNLDKVRAHFYMSPRIVMPANFRRNSCEYKLILKHEKRHLRALYDFHSENTDRYKAHLGRMARNLPIGPPVRTEAEVEEVKQHIMAYFDKGFYEQVNKSLIMLGRRQKKIDSPQEYRGVGMKIAKCEADRNNKNKKNRKVFD